MHLMRTTPPTRDPGMSDVEVGLESERSIARPDEQDDDLDTYADTEDDLVTMLERQHLRFPAVPSERLASSAPVRAPAAPTAARPTIGLAEAGELLRDERERIVRALEAASVEVDDADGGDELSTLDQHLADSATETYEREVAASIRETLQLGLLELDAADDRLAGGTYGLCERCHEPIDGERLRAEPATRWCLADAVAAQDQRS